MPVVFFTWFVPTSGFHFCGSAVNFIKIPYTPTCEHCGREREKSSNPHPRVGAGSPGELLTVGVTGTVDCHLCHGYWIKTFPTLYFWVSLKSRPSQGHQDSKKSSFHLPTSGFQRTGKRWVQGSCITCQVKRAACLGMAAACPPLFSSLTVYYSNPETINRFLWEISVAPSQTSEFPQAHFTHPFLCWGFWASTESWQFNSCCYFTNCS